MLSAAGSLQPNVAHPADMDDFIKSRLADAATQALPETKPIPEDGMPDLD